MADSLVFEEVEYDSVPDVSEVEYPCTVCGRESGPYGGRGRKPTKCDDHKGQGQGGKTTGGSKARPANDALARQATEALCQINGLLALGAVILTFTETAGAMAASEDDFRERTYAALLTDKPLCLQILKAGTSSAKIALVISYAFWGVSVLPVAINEGRAKKAARLELEEEEV